MEIHSVLPEERARTEKGETLPWAYRYADSSRNLRQPEESGPFGRNRSIRYTSSRRASTRTGTTPVRQKENSAVADFSRLLAKEQASKDTPSSTAAAAEGTTAPAPRVEPEATPTECVLYGYANKPSEWKVISRYERIASPGFICEDYPRDDPDLFLHSNSPMGFSRASQVVIPRQPLSREALRKSKIYRGGNHWIKITFDSYESAERACFYSPVEVDGYLVHCDLWEGKPPFTDAPIPKGAGEVGSLISRNTPATRARTLGQATGSGKASAIAGFESAFSSLPRNQKLPDQQFGQPQDDLDIPSTTASSATATSPPPTDLQPQSSGLRSRSVPHLPSQAVTLPTQPESQYMTAIPSVKRAVLRPISEALPPQPSFVEKLLRSLPLVSWLFGPSAPAATGGAGEKKVLIGDGPIVKEDGTWDDSPGVNGWYWGFWHGLDRVLGSDFCGLKED